MLNKQRTMIITPHLDDVEFGMGGTLVKLCKEHPENVKVLVLCEGRDEKNALARLSAFAKNIHLLGFQPVVYHYKDMELELVPLKEITKIIEDELEDFKPSRIFTTSETDIHQDHQICSKAVKIALRPNKLQFEIQEFYEFMIPGNNPWNAVYYDTVVDVSDVKTMKTVISEVYTTEKYTCINLKEFFKTIYRKWKI
jgi:LmbE family N-acetylglucosaminyl deacetylase